MGSSPYLAVVLIHVLPRAGYTELGTLVTFPCCKLVHDWAVHCSVGSSSIGLGCKPGTEHCKPLPEVQQIQ